MELMWNQIMGLESQESPVKNVIHRSKYRGNVESFNYLGTREIKSKIDMANQHSTSRSLRVMKPTLCTVYLSFIESLYLYVFRATSKPTIRRGVVTQ
jgi:hypothetical protein